MNSDKETLKRPANPYDNANVISKYIYWWLKDLFKIGLSRQIVEDDIYEGCRKHKSDNVSRRFEMLWDAEMQKLKPSLVRVATKVFWSKVIVVGIFFAIFETACKLTNPLLLGLLIGYFSNNPHNFNNNEAYLIATGIVLTLILPLLFFHPFMLFLFDEAMKLRIACCSLIYSKILTFSKYTIKDGIAGQAVNLMSNDVARFDWLMSFTHDVWRPPLAAAIAGFFIYQEVEFAGLLGMAILILFMPLQAWLGKKSANVRLETAQRTDKRVKSMFSIITGIQVIKMYGWENAFASTVNAIRKFEMKAIAKSYYIRATLLSLSFLTSLAVFATFVMYVAMGNEITSQKAFVTIAFFNYIRTSLVEFWPLAITSVAEGWVSLRRVEEFLVQKIAHRVIPMSDLKRKSVKIQSLNKGIFMRNATAYWNQSEDDNSQAGIISVDFEIEKKGLVCIIGQVASGKTTFLETILNELPLVDGEIHINGDISYAAQQAWIFEASVKNNIIFTEKYDEIRYKTVLYVCALNRDLELFPHGDETIVGDRGISLSGGQKARINLARAVYKNADLYLLDDVLSAVDAHVGKHIFDKCIKEYLKDKICVFVTHQLKYLPDVEHIVIMYKGHIKAQGSYDQIKNSGLIYMNENLIHSSTKVNETHADLKDDQHGNNTQQDFSKQNENQTVSKETQQEGKVTSAIYTAYLKAVNNGLFVICVAFLFIVAQAFQGIADYFVSLWVSWEEANIDLDHTTDDDDRGFWKSAWWSTERYIYAYTILIVCLLVFILSRSFAFYRMCLRVSMNLHDKLFRGVTRATMWFFNQNSTGRILNRFSKDIGTVDSMLPVVIVDCIQFYLQLVTIVTIVAIVNPWLLIPTLFMFIIFYALRFVFLTTARNIKRIEAITRSPLFAHTTSSIEGLSTIRAFNAETQLRNEFYEYQNVNSSAWFLFVATSRGFAFWLDVICVLYVTCVVYSFLWIGTDFIGANVGIAITQSLNLIGMCNWGLRQTAELENQMTSVERVVEYANLPSERSLDTNQIITDKMPQPWPQKGTIKFINMSLKYSETSKYILHSLNFTVHEKEKIGIVGRTGAGKSSIIQAIFQLALVDGTIEIDDVNINNLGLHTFRRKISIIPQDPVLFVGSLRQNLDPFDEKTDDEIWHILEQVELKHTIKLLASGLETKVSDGGTNFSMGQRQLLCLARAILRKNKILILDEATSNVDPETDHLIQTTIRTQFSDCTVLTVAHRLNTILDSDRIMVLEAGNIVEFDTPLRLHENLCGAFRKLIDEAGVDFIKFSRGKG